MNRTERAWIGAAAALAVGEGLATLFSRMAEFWAAAAVVSVLVMLFGFGLRLRAWHYAALIFVGISLFLHAKVVEERGYRDRPWMRGVERRVNDRKDENPVRRELSRRVGLGLEHDPEVAALNRAILLGERKNLPPRLRRTFVESGAIHVFAVSGLHVMAVAKILMVLAALCFVPLRALSLVVVPIVWAYVIMIGAPPSAVRAASMATIYFSATLFGRRPNGLISWAATFLIVHLIAPGMIENVGSQFSFVVMLVLIVASRLGKGIRSAFVKVLYFTVAAWAAGVPISAAVFGRVTPAGIVSNLFLVFSATYTVVAGAIGLLVSFVWEPLAVHFNNMAGLLTRFMVFAADSVSMLPGATIEVPKWGFRMCAMWYTALSLAFYLQYSIRRRRANIF